MGLNVSHHCHRHRLPLEASILFLVLAIATGGVDLVAQGEASIPGGLCGLCCWVMLIPGVSILLLGLFFWFSVGGLCGLCCWVMLILGASILLLGLFFWFSTGGLCGFRCDTGVDCGCGSVAVWVKK